MNTFFEKLEKNLIAVEDFFSIASSVLVAFMMLITTLDVILRYIFNSPLHGVFILCEMLMVGVVYFAVAITQRQKGHVRVDLFIDRVKGNPRVTLEIAILTLSLASFAIMVWQTGLYAWEAWITEDYTMGLLEYPLWPAKSVLTIGIGLLCLRFIVDIRHSLTELRRGSNWIFYSILAILPLVILTLLLVAVSCGFQFDPTTVGWIILAIMIVLLVGGVPVSFSLLILTIIGYWIIAGPERTFSIVGIIPYDKIANYTLSVVPLFILMGNLAYHTGLATSLYKTAQTWIGHIPGSLAQATVLGGAAFAAACGSGIASCATLAKICIPAMNEVGIDRKLAIGTVAGTGTIAQMIPPSILMVIYAVITDQSVAKLLIAGIIPGLIAAANYMIMIYIRCKLNPKLAPQLLKSFRWKERIISLKYSWGIAMLALIVMGGIYTGVFTPTEAGALGAFGALIIGFAAKRLNWGNIKEALADTTKTTGMIFLIICTALLFGYFLGISRIPSNVSDFLVSLDVPRFGILIGILFVYFIAGAFINMLAFAFLTLPIIFPAVVALGYDPLWFGVLTVHMFEIAAITPPFGLNLFVIRGMTGVNMGEIIQGVIWFSVSDIITLATYIAFPQLATWLPSLM